MSRVIGPCSFTLKPALKPRQQFNALALAFSLVLLLVTAYQQTVSLVRQQPDTKAQVASATHTAAAGGVQLPDLSSLDIPLLIRDSDRQGQPCIWIDAADRVVTRLEAWPAPRIEQSQETPGTLPETETLVYEQIRLSNGLWVPRRIRLNAMGQPALFNGTDKDMTFEFSHYQHFGTEVKDIQSVTLKP